MKTTKTNRKEAITTSANPIRKTRNRSGETRQRLAALEVLKKLRQVLQASRPQSSAVERRYGVTGAQLWALRELARQPGVRVTDLAAAMALHQSTVSNMIDKLIRKRLIRRERGDEDRRVVRLHLTVAAARVLRAAPTPGSGMLANALEGLPSSALTGLDRQLEALLSRMQSRAPERRV